MSNNKYLSSSIKSLLDERSILKVSEWAEKRRYLPAELSPISGYWDNSVTPYLVEIMDCLSQSSHIRELAFMKGAQIGATTGILENFIGYIIDHAPGPTLFLNSDQETAETAGELRIDRMLETSGLSSKIFSQGKGKNDTYNRKTGSSKSKKEFVGGFLLNRGARSGSKLRGVSARNLLADEIDSYPIILGEEGDPLEIAKKRTNAFSGTRKILYISTPLVKHTSRIEKAFQLGDQRYYYVPCKHCSEMQPLEFGNLKFLKSEDGRLIRDSVVYACVSCGGTWKNDDKAWFLPKGEWRATEKSHDPCYRSYHLSGLYSPIGMYSWERAVTDFIEAQKDFNKLRAWVNTVQGLPWEERGQTTSYQTIMSNREDYNAGTIPKDVLFLTLAADVHKDRIDVEVLGWADKCISYSIDWLHFTGKTDTVDGEAWQDLEKFILKGYNKYDIKMSLIDCGYLTDIVYSFCSRFAGKVHPIKGISSASYKNSYRIKNIDGYGVMVGIDAIVDFYKDRLHGWLQLVREEPTPWGYCIYPRNYQDEYFKQYSNEQKFEKRNNKGQLIGYEWRKRNSNVDNHAFDCRVYNLVAFDYLVDLTRTYLKEPDLTIEKFYEEIKKGLAK